MTDVNKIKDLFGGTWEPEIIEDSEGLDFNKPIKGKYEARIVELKRMVGTSDKTGNDYDFFALKLQVENDVEGDKSGGRYLDKTYFNGVSEKNDDPDKGVKALFNDLFTANLLDGLIISSSDKYQAAVEIAPQLVDKIVKISAWKNTWEGKERQVVKIVNEFKLKKEKSETSSDDSWS